MKDKVRVVVASGEIAKHFDRVSATEYKHLSDLEPQNLDGEGPSGKRPPESSRQETDEATFAKQLAHDLYRQAYNKDFSKLVIVADPDTLGEMRPVLHEEVTKRLIAEIDKTLINAPTDEIMKVVEAELNR
jgi:protein required for attachment to host cells